MKKMIPLLLILVYSCNSGQEQSVTSSSPDVKSQEQQSAAQLASSQVFFNGAGSEPGWTLVIESNSDGSFTAKLNHQDKGKSEFRLQKEALYVGGKANVTSGEVKLSGDGVVLSLLAGQCTDAAGRVHSHSCSYRSADERLSGCGDYAD